MFQPIFGVFDLFPFVPSLFFRSVVSVLGTEGAKLVCVGKIVFFSPTGKCPFMNFTEMIACRGLIENDVTGTKRHIPTNVKKICISTSFQMNEHIFLFFFFFSLI